MTPPSLLIIGGVSYNTMIYVDRFPEPVGQTLFARGYHDTVGSAGAGKAFNATRLGIDVTLYALLGADEPGARAAAALEGAGVRLLHDVDPVGTKRHVNLMDAAGERISIFLSWGSDEFPAAGARLEPLVAAADLATITIYNWTRVALPMLRRHGTPLWVDIHDWDGENEYHRDFIEAAELVQMSSVGVEDYRALMARLIEGGRRFVLCTHGAAGATGLDASGTWYEVEASPVAEVVDTNGAGDAFFAGLLWGRTRGWGWADAMRAGARAAARAVGSRELYHPGLSPADLET